VNRVRNEFLTCARLSLDQDGGVGGGNTFNLLQHLLQGTAVADDSLKAARLPILIAGLELLQRSHS
jgi:hypothetical protein